MNSQPPPYGVDSGNGYPMTTQPRSWAETHYVGGAPSQRPAHPRPLTPPPGALPNAVIMDPEGKANGNGNNGTTNNGGVTNNVNTNNNSSTSNNSVVVNANVTAGAGLGTGNHLVLVGKDLLMRRKWNSGLCSCMNDAVGCIFATVCLPLAMMRLANRVNECACMPCFVPGGFAALRTKLRTMGGIRGSICWDCAIANCCCFCAACQMKREMDDMKL